MKKVPTIVLSVSYKGVKFIDATNKVSLTLCDALNVYKVSTKAKTQSGDNQR